VPTHDSLGDSLGDAVDLTNRALRGESVDAVLHDGARLIARLLGAERCDVLEVPLDGSGPRPWPGLPESALFGSGMPDGWGAGLLDVTLAADGPVIRSSRNEGTTSWTVALRDGDVPVGLLGVFGIQPFGGSGRHVSLAETVAGALAAAITAQGREGTPRWHVRLDHLLIEISISFVDLEPDQIDDGIVDALAAVGGAIGATRAAVHRLSADDGPLQRTHVWTGSTSDTDLPASVTGLTVATFDRLRRGEVVQLEPQGGAAQMFLAVPLRAAPELLGFAAFAAAHTQSWPSDLHDAIRPLGDVIASAIGRQQAGPAQREEAEPPYRSLVESIADVIVHIDAEGGVSYVNPAWTALTGLALDDMIGRAPLDHVHPADQDIAAEHLNNAVQGNDDEEREVRFIDATGGVRWMEIKGRPLFDPNGELEGFTAVLHDVTIRHQLHVQIQASAQLAEQAREQAERAHEQSERASRSKSEFLTRMSLQLRTPLNAILGLGQLLQLGDLVADDFQNVDQILNAGRQLRNLIDEMSDLPVAAPPLDADVPALPFSAAAFEAPTCTVLYIEDNELDAIVVRRVLARRPHVRLVVVHDGLEGVERAHRLVPDLVLLDLHLPGLDGAGVISVLRGSDRPEVRDVPVVVLSTDLAPDVVQRLADSGATQFLTKPIDVALLLGIIDEHLSLHERSIPERSGHER
jgi:PAS domain S-box-containing protein